ncbi:MAG: arsenate reductase ArsC [Desulfobulbaceae bacterium]|nr:MAG: arsenate reductase ArsC [Desulfobulbaceae bacterium]
MRKILFICEHNSARSQMAEAFLKHLSKGKLEAESAGLEPGTINPIVVEVMKEVDIDLSGNTTQSVFDLFKSGKQYDAVVTVCTPEVSEKCPIFPGKVLRLNWPFNDPSTAQGSESEKLEYVRGIRDQIKDQVQSFVDDFEDRGIKVFMDEDD